MFQPNLLPEDEARKNKYLYLLIELDFYLLLECLTCFGVAFWESPETRTCQVY